MKSCQLNVAGMQLNSDNHLSMSTFVYKLKSGFRSKMTSAPFVLAFILAAGALIRIAWLDGRGLWYDELYTVWASKLGIRSVISEAAASGHPPLYYLLGHFWFAVASGDVGVRMLSWAAGVATIGIVYLAGKELFDSGTGMWAAALAAFSPVLVWYSRQGTSYSWLVFLSVAFLWLLVRSAKRGGLFSWCGYMLTGAAVCLTYYLGPILIVAGWPLYWLVRERSSKRGGRWWLTGQAGLIAVALAISLTGRAKLARHWLVFSWPHPDLIVKGLLQVTVVFTGGDWMVNDLNYGGSVLSLPGPVVFLMASAAAAAALAIVFYSRHVRHRLIGKEAAALAILAFLLLIGPIIADVAMGRPLAARFYLWAAPPLLVLAGAALDAARRRSAALAGMTLLAVLLGLTAIELKFDDNRVGNWRALMATVSHNRGQNDLLYCFPLHECAVAASFYLSKPMPLTGGFPATDTDSIFFAAKGVPWDGYRSGYFTGSGLQLFSTSQANKRINEDVSGFNRVWLVDSDNSDGSSPATAERLQALEINWRLVDKWDFPGDMLFLFVRK